MVKITPLGSKILIENGTQKPFTVDKEEIEFTIVNDTHVSFNILGGVPVLLSDLEIDGDTPADMDGFKNVWSEVFPDAGQSAGSTGLFQTTGTGTATGNVIGDLDGNTLIVQQGGVDFLTIDPTADGEISRLKSFNNTGDGNVAYFQASTANTNCAIQIKTEFNGGVTEANFEMGAESGLSIMLYEADTHTFTGAVKLGSIQEFADNAAALSGGLEVGNLYHTAGVLKIVLEA